MEEINTQIFLAYCEYRARKPTQLMCYLNFRMGMLRYYELVHLWLAEEIKR